MTEYTNRLIHETSPYLLQHAHNPVDWYPWGEEALQRARTENKPILLSIGYSACHWCHVMEHESFEDEATARLMNEHFVNIKVDREERPDLDAIYMDAVQAMTGRGGWPMTVFLTPDGVPFYGGTYFPPQDRHGLPGFNRLLTTLAEIYHTRPDDIANATQQIKDRLSVLNELEPSETEFSVRLLDQAYFGLRAHYDPAYGGFGGAPKFPPAMTLEFLLRTFLRAGYGPALDMVEHTLARMARGGIYDQLGGGFHRYSVDQVWLVPHFEKMLYDNALLSRVYLHAYQVTGQPLFRRVVEETFDYVVREMTDPEGGFYSTQDADSESEEGKFFIWTPDEIRDVLGEADAALFMDYFAVTEAGNFEGKNILSVPRDPDVVAYLHSISEAELVSKIDELQSRMFQAREQRVKPGRDDKVLTGWNGLMLTSFAEAAAVLSRDDYRQVAERNAAFLLDALVRDGRLLRTWKDGQARLKGYLEDYACLAGGLLALYETTFDLHWFRAARELASQMIDLFWDSTQGGFFTTGHDHEALITRPKDFFDNAVPSGNSAATDVLLRLFAYTGEPEYERRAVEVLRLLVDAMTRSPNGFGYLLCALDRYLSPSWEIAVIGDRADSRTQALLNVVRSRFRPNTVVALASPGYAEAPAVIPLLANRPQRDGRPTAYVCEQFTCQAPVTEPEALARQLDHLVKRKT
jgi:uncharacterized protein YyaL (SSP411 family)